jgi:hypothetical protein
METRNVRDSKSKKTIKPNQALQRTLRVAELLPLAQTKKTSMKLTLLSFLLIPTILLHAADTPPNIQDFANEYWAAVKSKNTEKIFSYMDPRCLQQLTPDEQKFVKADWIKTLNQAADNQGDSQEITAQSFPATAPLPFPTWRWSAKPEYVIQVQTFKKVPSGKEGLDVTSRI